MNDFLLSILLGIVEGLTEFLPVSSTGHLRIVEALFQLNLGDSFWKMYTIVIQLGAILALPVYFRDRILKFLSTFPKGERGDRNFLTHPLSLTMVAFVVTALPAWALTKVIGKNLESLWVISIALLVGGIVMWIVDATFTRARVAHMEDMNLFQAIWIGACQILSAVFPGTSRSMSTIAAGQIAGLSRPAALEFSFFLSMPTMVVATLYDLYKTLKPGRETLAEGNIAPLAVDAHQWVVLAIGFVVSFIVALVVVAWFMRWVRTKGFVPFAIYRIALAIVLIILLMRGSI
ncbi:MAG TPA: undecaprenyl-diphosphate phosphatase [Chthoniobacterales bacterium]|jgi:undecaprenyl-diphosphatase|nr:undecaprenyl-diphosphate phosphatase [Chthoniobacterales bacterium]